MHKSHVLVAIRVRPPNKRETVNGFKSCVEADDFSITVGKNTFSFDTVLGDRSTQLQIHARAARPVLYKVLDGFNGTVMAFGQTGSGKTYTMQGVQTRPGVIPRLCDDLFTEITKRPNMVYEVKASYVELYLEAFRDLLSDQVPIIHEDPKSGVHLQNAMEVVVDTTEDIARLFNAGASRRTTGSTAMNAESSRSHALFSLFITCKERGDEDESSTRTSKFHLLDLAGSERASSTGATGQRLKEGAKINKSLSVLGNVINLLSAKKKKGQAAPHIPYRDSKLTRLLQDSLGGNAFTSIIINVSPSAMNESETLSTLRFAARAKQVQNKAKINQDPRTVKLRALQAENDLLHKQVNALKKQVSGLGEVPVEVVASKEGAKGGKKGSSPRRRSSPPPMGVRDMEEDDVDSVGGDADGAGGGADEEESKSVSIADGGGSRGDESGDGEDGEDSSAADTQSVGSVEIGGAVGSVEHTERIRELQLENEMLHQRRRARSVAWKDATVGLPLWWSCAHTTPRGVNVLLLEQGVYHDALHHFVDIVALLLTHSMTSHSPTHPLTIDSMCFH